MGKGTSINYPAQQPYGESMQAALDAQVKMAPALYAAEADPRFGRPAYAQLEEGLMQDAIMGTRKPPTGTVLIESNEQRWALYVDTHPDLKKNFAAKLKAGEATSKSKFGQKHWKEYGKDEVARKTGRKFPSGVGSYYNKSKRAKVNKEDIPREGGLVELMGSTKEMADGRKPGYDAAGEFLGMTKLGEDLRQQSATTTRAADLKDVRSNLTTFDIIMKRTNPQTQKQMRLAIVALGDEAKRLGVDTITDPAKLQDVAKTLQGKGKLTPLIKSATQEARGPLDEMTAGVATRDDVGVADRRIGKQMMKGTRPRADQMDLGERLKGKQMLAGKRGQLDQMSVLERAEGERMGGYAEMEDPFGLRQTMQQQAAEDLAAGRGLTPRQRREAEQSARRWGQAAGRGLDPLAAVREVEELMEASGAEQARRRAFAGQVLGQEAGIQTGELGRGMQQAGANIQQEVARQEANLGRQLTAEEFNALQEAQRQRENIASGMGARQQNIQQEVARQEANLGRRLTEQEFNTLQESSRQEANIARGMGARQQNIQQEVARQEANLGRELTAQEFNAMQDAAMQEANLARGMEAERYNIGMGEQRTEADIARDLGVQQFNIQQTEARREGDIGRELGAAGADITQQMQQEQMNEQLRQRQLQGYLGGTGQVAALEQQGRGDPLQAILGRQSGTAGFGMGQQMYGGAGTALSASPGVVFNPEAGLSYMLGQQGQQAGIAAAQAGASAQRSAGIFGGIGSIVGGMASGGTGIFS